MKYLLSFFIILSFALSTDAIIVVPPVIYIASISVLSVVIKLSILFFAWLAVQGFASRRLLGKEISVIMASIIPQILNAMLIFTLILLASLIFSPKTYEDASIASFFVAFFASISRVFWLLRSFANSNEKNKMIFGFIILFFIILILSYLVISSSISVSIIPNPSANVSSNIGGHVQ